MRVLVGPGLQAAPGSSLPAIARALAGSEDEVIFLRDRGLRPFHRRLSQAEVHLVRQALAGGDPYRKRLDDWQDPVIGYLCAGMSVAPGSSLPAPATALLAVADHGDLTWASPLTGPGGEELGPRFPRVDTVYAPEVAMDRLAGAPGVTINVATVAAVRDPGAMVRWERDIVEALAFAAVSSELAPIAVIAAHLGFRLAAVLMLEG